MIYGNHHTYTQLKTLIERLLTDESQIIYPFIIIAWPAHIGKSSIVRDIIGSSDLNHYDVVTMQDLSDDWMLLKESNDLTGTSHSIQIEVESKRQDIRLEDGSLVHNWWVRELQEWLVRSPLGRDKVVLIEAIERATGWASNALLKTLEEPLPHRLMIATTHSISQLPATITSRAMIFHADRLSEEQMQWWMQEYLPDYPQEQYRDLMVLATGRPWLVARYHQKWILDDILLSYKQLVSQLDWTWMLATLYQQISAINKSGYVSIILDAILYASYEQKNYILYDATFDLIRKQDSNINIDNLLFEWCVKISGR
jgi:hypothetical protein